MAVAGQNFNAAVMPPNMGGGAPYIMGRGRGRGRGMFGNFGGWGNWNQQPQQPTNYNLDLGSLQEAALGILPKNFAGANRSLGQSLGLATQLSEEENRRNQAAVDFMRQQFDITNKMSGGLSQQEIDLRLGRASDAATEGMMQNASAARSLLGATGVTGGGQAAALEGAMRLGRMAQIQGARRDLAAEEAARRAQAANEQFNRAGVLGEYMSRGPSMLQLDQLNSVIDTGLNAFIGEQQARAARKASKDSKNASILGSVTSLLPF